MTWIHHNRPEKECPELPDPPHGQVLNSICHYNLQGQHWAVVCTMYLVSSVWMSDKLFFKMAETGITH